MKKPTLWGVQGRFRNDSRYGVQVREVLDLLGLFRGDELPGVYKLFQHLHMAL